MQPSSHAAQTWRARTIHVGLRRIACVIVVAATGLVLSGCEGVQSTLEPAGRGAEEIATLFWWLVGGAVVVWIVVIGVTLLALHVQAHESDARRAKMLILGGGTALPTVVLAAYLIYGLDMLPELIEPAPEGSLTIAVSGEQWWWRVRYPASDARATGVETANEIRLPVGEPVQFYLESPDVIHSFWIPSIGGKMDMIPGRTTRLTLHPTRTGVFRGACAEYCGSAHALMSFYAVVMERDAFDAWLENQEAPASEPSNALAARGADLFLENGCGACHAVRGTEADGKIGPDLTHVGSRVSLGAALLGNEVDDFYRWLSETEHVKPDVHMPSFGMLPDADLHALAAYLEGLQ